MSTTEVNVDLESPVASQDKDAHRAYIFDLTRLIPADDSIAAVAWTIPTGIVKDGQSLAGNVATVELSGGTVSTWYAVVASWVTVGGLQDQFVLRLFIKADAESLSGLGTALFPNRFTAVARLRADRLLLAAAGALPKISVSDDYLWDKLRAAESETQRELRVFFAPTTMFPDQPTQAEIDALMGAAWAIDPGYDFGPENFYGDKWGLIVTRQKPIISVTSLRMIYPSPGAVDFTFPAEWLRLDRKYGHIRIVPTSTLSLASLSASVMQLFSSRVLPQAMEVRYVAGLENATRDYPELVDLVLKRAALKIIGDRFLPQSGSISADGLSQSFSSDMGKHYESIDIIMNGPKGSNGGLMTAIHGIRMSSLG